MIIANHDRNPPPEFPTDELVTAFESVTSQLEAALSDPTMRRLLLADRQRILAACETALAIEDALDEPAVSAEYDYGMPLVVPMKSTGG